MTAQEMPDVIYAFPEKGSIEWEEGPDSDDGVKYIRADAFPGDKQAALEDLEGAFEFMRREGKGPFDVMDVLKINPKHYKTIRAALLHDDSEMVEALERIRMLCDGENPAYDDIYYISSSTIAKRKDKVKP